MLTEHPLPRAAVKRDSLHLAAGDLYVYRASPVEDRAHLPTEWIASQRAGGATFLPVLSEDMEWITVQTAAGQKQISLFDSEALATTVGSSAGRVWIDITGLEYSSWAPCIRAAYQAGLTISAVYAEPERYNPSPSPVERLKYNLSKRTQGPRPLPGFARLTLPSAVEAILIPFMGFEGERLQRVLGDLPYEERRTFPVLGIPGFKADYPFHSLEANLRELERPPLHRNIRFARANCPFESFLAVSQVAGEEEASAVVLAPIGTKPHALGALLYWLAYPEAVTLVYDHPVRSEGRTRGAGPINVYDLSAFLDRCRVTTT